MMGEGCGQDKRETLGRNDEGWQQEVTALLVLELRVMTCKVWGSFFGSSGSQSSLIIHYLSNNLKH